MPPLDLTDRLPASFGAVYVLDRELGRGGMATVYLAEDRRHRRHVALKVLNSELWASVGAERRESHIGFRLKGRRTTRRRVSVNDTAAARSRPSSPIGTRRLDKLTGGRCGSIPRHGPMHDARRFAKLVDEIAALLLANEELRAELSRHVHT